MNEALTQDTAAPAVQSIPEVDFTVAPADEITLVRYEIVLDARLQGTVTDYNAKRKTIGRANSDLKDIRGTLTYELALLKAVHVGRGRDGDWGDYLKKKFGLARRTVDRWVKKEVSQGQLPPWASEKLIANMDPDPAPKQDAPIFALNLIFKTKQERDMFADHCRRLSPDRLCTILFETITLHEETQPDYKRSMKAFVDEDGPEPSFLAQMEQHVAAAGVAA
jgi:hypothetical protein